MNIHCYAPRDCDCLDCNPAPLPTLKRKLKRDKRSQAIRLAMRDLRRRRHAEGLNSHGKPLGENAKFRNLKYK